jgi:DNA-binding IclR family transcriptional regulator
MPATGVSVQMLEGPLESGGPSGDAVVKSAGRVLLILEYFDRVQRPANLIDISTALHLPLSSTSHLLRSMVSLGFLRLTPKGRTYLPTSRVSLLGTWTDPRLFREGKIYELVEELRRVTGKTVVLSDRSGIHSRCIFSVVSADLCSPRPLVGSLRPLHETASGLALLSKLDMEDAGKILRRLHAELPNNSGTFQSALINQKIQEARTLGVLISRDVRMPPFGEIARPIVLSDGSIHTVACVGPFDEILRDYDALVEQLEAAEIKANEPWSARAGTLVHHELAS